MIIDVSRVDEGVFDFKYDEGGGNFEGFSAKLITPVSVSGEFRKAGEGYFVSGTIIYDLEYPCAKCIEPVKKHYNLSFQELFGDESEEGYTVQDDKIDITPLVDENIILNIEGRVLCKDDCKGLCPVCGTNLNINKCNCDNIEEISQENPFAVLKDITTGGAEDGSTKKKNIKAKTQHKSR